MIGVVLLPIDPKRLLYYSDKRNSLQVTCLYSALDFEIFTTVESLPLMLDSSGLPDLVQEHSFGLLKIGLPRNEFG